MENKDIIKRKDLIEKISKGLNNIRKEAKLTQDEMANILGISKNTIINAEKNEKQLSWAVVIAILVLFNQTTYVKSIIGEEKSAIEVISKCAFLDKDLNNNDNNMLYTTAITGLSLIPPILGGVLTVTRLIDLLNNKEK